MAETEITSGQINFAGLGNGTDFNKLIDGLVKIEQQRVTRLETWKKSWELKNEHFKDLNSKMLTLKTQLEGLDSMNEFMSKAVSSNDKTLLTATANSEAQLATHSIEIGQLATNDILITTSGASSLSSKITNTTTSFTFSYGGKSITINNIAAGTTLEGFVNILNNHADTRGKIEASTIFDGSVYHLQITGSQQGADNQLVISNAGSIIFGQGDFTETQNAQNAQIRINGFPASNAGWIERSSNVLDDVITGLKLDLKAAKPGTQVSLTVNMDKEGMVQNVTKFVDAINVIRAKIIAITKVDKTKGSVSTGGKSLTNEVKGAALTGNYGVDMIAQKLKDITARIGMGFSVWDPKTLEGDKVSSLSQLGILTDAQEGSTTYGLLKIDYDKLQEAIDADPNAVAAIFAMEPTAESQSPDFTALSIIEGTTKPGSYEVTFTSDGTQITSATINGEPASISGWEITGKDGDATGLAIRLDNTTAGTHTGKVAIRVGKSGEMVKELEELTKPFNKYTYEGGPLAVLQNNYNDIMESIDDKIAFENSRISKMERNLRLKFSRLDALLGQYSLKQGQLATALQQLSK